MSNEATLSFSGPTAGVLLPFRRLPFVLCPLAKWGRSVSTLISDPRKLNKVPSSESFLSLNPRTWGRFIFCIEGRMCRVYSCASPLIPQKYCSVYLLTPLSVVMLAGVTKPFFFLFFFPCLIRSGEIRRFSLSLLKETSLSSWYIVPPRPRFCLGTGRCGEVFRRSIYPSSTYGCLMFPPLSLYPDILNWSITLT